MHELRATASNWVTAEKTLPFHLGAVALAGAIALVVSGLVIAFREHRLGGPVPGGAPMLPLVSFVVVYLVYVVASEFQTRIDPLQSRLLSPLFAPVIVLVVIALEQVLDLDWVTSRRWLTQGTAILIALWLFASLAQSANRARSATVDGESGRGLAAKSWIHADLAAAVRKLPAAARIYSNTADGLYVTTGRQPVYPSPSSHEYRSYATTDERSAFRRAVVQSHETVYLVWRTPENRRYILTPADLRRSGLQLQHFVTAANGSIYKVTSQ